MENFCISTNAIIRATSSLHLLPLERHERLLGVVEVDEPGPLGRVVEELVVLLDEGLANLKYENMIVLRESSRK